jgi:hypothetical protein
MNRLFVVLGLSLSGLAGCGGGGGGSEGGTLTPTGGTGPTTISSIPNGTLGTFADGAKAERFIASDDKLYVGLINDSRLTTVLKNQSFAVTSSSVSGSFLQDIDATQNADGAALKIYVHGLYLNDGETVSIAFFDSATYGAATLAVGSPPKTIPAQSVSYSGAASITEISAQYNGSTTPVVENGDFTLTIDLSGFDPVGTLSTSNMATFQFSSGDVVLEKTTGTLTSNDVQIGRITGSQQAGYLLGSLYGSNSEGVAGVVRSNTNTPATYLGTFYGKR